MHRKTYLILLFALLQTQMHLLAQRSCGTAALKVAIVARDPSARTGFEAQRSSLQNIADIFSPQVVANAARKTTTAAAIPVIFHVIVTDAQFAAMGGAAGIAPRCDSQILVLERDFNKGNADSSAIPLLWRPLYANVGIHFALAHTAPTGWGTPGYEIRIVPTPTFFFQGAGGYEAAKHEFSLGMDAWDNTKYLNVWCFEFADNSSLLGITVPQSYAPAHYPQNEVGICMSYNVLGKKGLPGDVYPANFDLGRTLTHECGHFFEIWHTWGDDGGSCPWTGTHKDDGLADTPPEANNCSGDPVYSVTGGTITDGCIDSSSVNQQPIGIPCLDFMDYTIDKAMHMFTTQQAAVMYSQIAAGGENYSLTLHPELLLWPPNTGSSIITSSHNLHIFPLPASDHITFSYDGTEGEMNGIIIHDELGRTPFSYSGPIKNFYSIDVSRMSKGIYFVTCNFASGNFTRKILLQ